MRLLPLLFVAAGLTLGSSGAAADPPKGICNPHGWCWTNPLPQGSSFRAVWQSPSKALWAVGGAGTVMVRRGGSWQLLPPSGTSSAADIWGCSDNNVWIAAKDFWHYNGEKWTQYPAPDGADFHRIDGRSCRDIWAVGTANSIGVIARWDGTSWTSVKPPARYSHYFDVLVLEHTVLISTDRYKFGQGRQGIVLHWDGAGWSTEQLDSTVLRSLSRAHGGLAWGAVLGKGQVSHLSDRGWTTTKVGVKHHIARVRSLAIDSVYAMGDRQELARWDGSSWRYIDTLDHSILDIGLDDQGEIWGVGAMGTMVHLTDTGIKPYSHGFLGSTNRFWHDGTSLWSVGEKFHGEPVVLRWAAGQWQQVKLPEKTAGLSAIWGTGINDLWFGGARGQLLHYNGQKWERHIVEPRVGWRAIAGYGSKDIWAFADGGLAAHYNGSSWELQDDLTLLNLWDATLVGQEIWVVGDEGILLRHCQKRGWRRPKSIPKAGTLLTIAAASPQNVRVAGENGDVFRWNGQTWSQEAKLDQGYVRGLAQRTGSWWAVGDSGYWHLQPRGKWTRTEVGTAGALLAVHPHSNGSIWIGGSGSAILRHP